MITYALDTNIISLMLKGDTEVIGAYQKANSEGHILVVPVAAYYEIRRGLLAVNATAQAQAFARLCSVLGVSEMDINIWEKAAEIWAFLKKRGTPLGKDDGDIFIAAQCIVNGYTLVTDNTRHFENIDRLKIVNWKA